MEDRFKHAHTFCFNVCSFQCCLLACVSLESIVKMEATKGLLFRGDIVQRPQSYPNPNGTSSKAKAQLLLENRIQKPSYWTLINLNSTMGPWPMLSSPQP